MLNNADFFTGGANSNLSYTLHLLLNTHPATSKIKALKKLPNLEEKMRYLLDDFGALQEIGESLLRVTYARLRIIPKCTEG